MSGTHVAVRTHDGAAFDCYVALPAGDEPTPAVVLASSIDGVDADLRDIADVFASEGFIAVDPDLFWRTVPGPLPEAIPGLSADHSHVWSDSRKMNLTSSTRWHISK